MNQDKMEQISSCFDGSKQGLSRLILDAIGSDLVRDQQDLKQYILQTLFHAQINIRNPEEAWILVEKVGKEALNFLIFNEIILQEKNGELFNFSLTSLGQGILKSN